MLTAAALVRETMAPSQRVQAIFQVAGGAGSIVADSHPDGSLRGLVRRPTGAETLTIVDGSLLQVMRTLPRGQVHKGVVAVPPAGGISDAVMTYMQGSEQVVSVISVSSRSEGDDLVAAGGYVVQLLPEVSDAVLAVMTERLNDFPTMERFLGGAGASPERLMEELLYGMDFTELDRSPLRFGCQCSQVRVLASLATLARADIEDLMRDGSPLEINCEYCGVEYHVEPEQLRVLLSEA
jgi:molecular chaperone Hsp33